VGDPQREKVAVGRVAGMALPLVALVWLHGEMSHQMMDPSFHQTDPRAFLSWHPGVFVDQYVSVGRGMAFVVLSLRAWRAEDAGGTNMV